jgi:hypothetical protein
MAERARVRAKAATHSESAMRATATHSSKSAVWAAHAHAAAHSTTAAASTAVGVKRGGHERECAGKHKRARSGNSPDLADCGHCDLLR